MFTQNKSLSGWLINMMLILLVLGWSAKADEVIKIRLSYKIIINPLNGNRPTIGTSELQDSDIQTAVDGMNDLLDTYWRGYRMELVSIEEIGNPGGAFPDPSLWFFVDFSDEENGAEEKQRMEEAAKNNELQYRWKSNAINIYINQATGGGRCSFPNDELIVVGAGSVRKSFLQLHELGHYFKLYHTQGRVCGECEAGEEGECHTDPGDDEVEDTIGDLQCWNYNDIARANFNLDFNLLPENLKEIVRDVAENIMSYHHLAPISTTPTRLTEGQLDVWTDVANSERQHVVDGKIWFVGYQGSNNDGTSTHPFIGVGWGEVAANPAGGDIILLKPGTYPASLTIEKPVTLRATRAGLANIGGPGSSQSNSSKHYGGAMTGLRKSQLSLDKDKAETASLPGAFRLEQNYPNPFNPSTTISFALPQKSKISLKVFDTVGRLVTTLVNDELQPGVHNITFNAQNLPSGIYFYKLDTKSFSKVKRMILMK